MEEVTRLGGLTWGWFLPTMREPSPADRFWNALNLTQQEKIRIQEKMYPPINLENIRARRERRRARALEDAKPVRGTNLLLLNPPSREGATQSILASAARKAIEPAPVERPAVKIAAQPVKKKDGNRAGKLLSQTPKRLNAFLKWWREGYSKQEAIAKAAWETKGTRYKWSDEKLNVRRAVKKLLESIPECEWGSKKFE
jgi:hypothetical protein